MIALIYGDKKAITFTGFELKFIVVVAESHHQCILRANTFCEISQYYFQPYLQNLTQATKAQPSFNLGFVD